MTGTKSIHVSEEDLIFFFFVLLRIFIRKRLISRRSLDRKMFSIALCTDA